MNVDKIIEVVEGLISGAMPSIKKHPNKVLFLTEYYNEIVKDSEIFKDYLKSHNIELLNIQGIEEMLFRCKEVNAVLTIKENYSY
jgi:hypothetical protein